MPVKVQQVVILARYLDEKGKVQHMEQQLFDVQDFKFNQVFDAEGLLSTSMHVVSGKKVSE